MSTTASVPPTPSGFRFGRFELDSHARELRKDGVRLRLQDQPFSVLLMLVQRPGDVFTRDELRRQLWPDGTFVDFEHGLNAAVKRLRAALGDDADNPRFIETVHRRGYRFIARADRLETGRSGRFKGGDAVAPRDAVRPDEGSVERSDRKLRLAVLPFVDLGDKGSNKYFSEGLTEEMITQIGRRCASRLGVVARFSSMSAQRHARTAWQIGQALRADYLVEGTVRREADRVRITVQLIETRGETHLWAESYERHLADCFGVQSEVATDIAHSLAMELLPDPLALRGVGTRHVLAHQAYLIGRYHWNKSAPESIDQAAAYFGRALRLDPMFATAYAALGRTHVAAANHYLRNPLGALEEARAAAARALELDPTDSEAHLTVAEVRKGADWDWNGAEEAYRMALAFNPSSEGAYRLYGSFLAARGRSAEATLAAGRACDLDPLCLTVNTSAAWVRYLSGDYDEAIERCQHTLDMDRQFVTARRQLAAALLADGRPDEAIAELEGDPAGPHDPVSLAWLAHALGTQNAMGRAAGLLEQLTQMAADRYVSLYHLALAYVGLGRTEEAFSKLNEACDARDPAIIDLGAEPRFQPLHSDLRYQALLARLGL